ncbi:MAG TPA: tRNA (adenosine(37)-N6)-threonylcarbamoyltransferase complex ATPase subunit type 1 TsaE [Flexilinea sp.]|nr:tRNA (adenosine(37)-N6)-threonylcarbamoyltransferase complex ATPase subunit type 1 TsaE [Flexilinea sp.]OQA28394.1 MAG: tRNA threonylcarbamoyladenosine biosynthesis protein TsaE [Chloroflexi bacterium ADurb.Bin344]HNY93099.1 tRNA (adenosine(37)-N6)-threonylcarbamoyltransferase complex ATPase subunit type 1 TsaE [Flexilinea sp.]HOG60651.1 tRNA (adenosine(37)-N6)-threonylcarbamoyltransferase complex ATPase subunit type 1 TsaE [Flexilinea sp.]HOP01009.1 tRNA (adenosine(37)-N6)-threonylcarbamoyl
MPILDSETLEIFSRSADQTRRFGMRLGRMLQNGDVLCFSGDLGSGKTTFIQGIAQGWGSVDQVTSPTFVLVNEYYRMDGSTLFHMDAYRIDSTLEAEELDIDRMLHQGVLVVEWAERIDSVLPKERLTIKMAWVADEQRSLVMVPYGERYQTLLHSFRHRSFGV